MVHTSEFITDTLMTYICLYMIRFDMMWYDKVIYDHI